ncbi:MAG: hypothetical protein COT74_08800 [Bdellovibrionales bacterium CG10_big_fil_rev_8_21_14_0_10_45_34]|nr:MAG: hypothetical protein COT74_08800 [Bdellovibrionales bacterium CG10_big_fil_rev_8_21_14_0_10_45_34]
MNNENARRSASFYQYETLRTSGLDGVGNRFHNESVSVRERSLEIFDFLLDYRVATQESL